MTPRFKIAVTSELWRLKWATETAHGTLDLAWPWPRGNCKNLPDINKHQSCTNHAMQKHTPESNEAHPGTIDRKIHRFHQHDLSYDVITSWPDSKFSGHVSNWIKRGHWKLICDLTLFLELFTKNNGDPFDPIQVRGLMHSGLQEQFLLVFKKRVKIGDTVILR